MRALENKMAVVTGAGAGIGRATARLFAREEAAVVVAVRREPELETLVAAIRKEGGQALAAAGGVADQRFARNLVDRALPCWWMAACRLVVSEGIDHV